MAKLNQKDLSNNACATYIRLHLPATLADLTTPDVGESVIRDGGGNEFSVHQIRRTLQAMRQAGQAFFHDGEWQLTELGTVRRGLRTETQVGGVGLQIMGQSVVDTEQDGSGVFCPVEAMLNEGAPAHD